MFNSGLCASAQMKKGGGYFSSMLLYMDVMFLLKQWLIFRSGALCKGSKQLISYL